MTKRPRVTRFLAPILAAVTLVVMQPAVAGACSCAPVTTAEMVAAAEVVFVGEEVGRVETREVWPSVAVTFDVIEAYKGEVTRQMTIWTGGGGGDCGVGPLQGPVGIAAQTDGGRMTFNICGGVHDPGAVAAVIDPIGLLGSPEPSPESAAAGGVNPWLAAGAIGAVLTIAGIVLSNRRDDWQDGWNSGG